MMITPFSDFRTPMTPLLRAEFTRWTAQQQPPSLAQRVADLAAEKPVDADAVAYLLADTLEGPFGQRTPQHVQDTALEWVNSEGLFATEGDVRRALGLHPDFTPTDAIQALADAYRRALRFAVETVDAAKPVIALSVAALGTRAVAKALDDMNPTDLPEVAVTALRAALRDHLREQVHGPRIVPSKLTMDWSLFTIEGDRDDRELDRQIAALMDDPYPEGADWDRDVQRLYDDAITECPDISYLRLAQITVAAFELDPDSALLSLEGTGTPQAVLGAHVVLTEATAAGVVWLGRDQLDWLEAEASLARTHLGISTPAA